LGGRILLRALCFVNRTLVHEIATGRYMGERAPVLIVGPRGTGKSHLAQALGHCAVRQGVDVVFTTCAQLTQSQNAARAIGAYERKLTSLARVPLLIVDDFGLKPLRPPARPRSTGYATTPIASCSTASPTERRSLRPPPPSRRLPTTPNRRIS
jgi:hypothetical protein